MRKEHRQQGGLSIVTVIGVWVVYIAHLVLTLLAALSGLWPLPINDAMGFVIGCVAILVGVGWFVAGEPLARQYGRQAPFTKPLGFRSPKLAEY